jgi:lysophospholipase L1-like esterase
MTATVAAVVCELVPFFGPLRVLSPPDRAAPPEAASAPASPSIGEALLDEETLQRSDWVGLDAPAQRRASGSPIAAPAPSEPLEAINVDAPPVELVDPSGAMRAFYRALASSARKEPQAITRILYHGDSLVASDYVTSTLRRKFQQQFGDAGHGFVLMANAWSSYSHSDVFRFSTRGWSVSRIVGPYLKDGFYGLGGVSFKGPPGIRAQFGTAREGDYGRNVSVFEVAYLKQPSGGAMRVNIDGEFRELIATDAPEKSSGFYRVEVPDGEHVLELVTERNMVRAFGVVLERKGPGVVLDAIGVQGARIRFLDKQDDEHWAAQLKWRKPDLLVFQFGANESGDGFAYSMPDYHQTMREVILQAQRALPNAGCLILSAMDRARVTEWGMITVPIIPHIVEQQRKTALDVGCAFWNTYEAMGGNGSMARWVRRGLGQADLTHPNSVGADILGNWIYQALIKDYQSYLADQERDP